jgi:hypothetical protein
MSIFVRRPLLFLLVAALFGLLFLLARFTAFGTRKRPGSLAIAAAAWAMGGIWEYLVMTRTPEANIRVDLLILLPVLGILSLWSLFRTLRPGDRRGEDVATRRPV